MKNHSAADLKLGICNFWKAPEVCSFSSCDARQKKKKILFLQSHFYCVCMRDRHNKVFVCGQQQTEFFLPLSPGLNRKLSSHLKVDHELHMPRNQNFESGCKVIHPKYFRHWPYLLASTMDCCYNKEMNQDLKHGLYVLLSSYLVKNTLIKIWFAKENFFLV